MKKNLFSNMNGVYCFGPSRDKEGKVIFTKIESNSDAKDYLVFLNFGAYDSRKGNDEKGTFFSIPAKFSTVSKIKAENGIDLMPKNEKENDEVVKTKLFVDIKFSLFADRDFSVNKTYGDPFFAFGSLISAKASETKDAQKLDYDIKNVNQAYSPLITIRGLNFVKLKTKKNGDLISFSDGKAHFAVFACNPSKSDIEKGYSNETSYVETAVYDADLTDKPKLEKGLFANVTYRCYTFSGTTLEGKSRNGFKLSKIYDLDKIESTHKTEEKKPESVIINKSVEDDDLPF